MFKKILVLSMLLCCLALPALAGTLVPSSASIDFGTLIEGPVAQKKVTLSNTGNEAVTITNVTTS
ncbi:MAG: hypothetical protein PHO79_00795 [Desulfoplanes sp.]|nr:hypothetical protein [Desulfoplanes sp.]MDD4648552.1 hypothetical protein [Desulfoplanes sp.]